MGDSSNSPVSGDKDGSKEVLPKSCSQILKEPPAQSHEVSFEYFPLLEGETVVTPFDEELLEGAEKLKCYLMGTFTKGTLPFKDVKNTATRIWKKLVFCVVYQKNETTYVFKFNYVKEKANVLSRGTWYFENMPLVLSSWGSNVGKDQIKEVPLWIKLYNVPYYYWTARGLSRLASVVGKSLCADNFTSKLESLPFAKM